MAQDLTVSAAVVAHQEGGNEGGESQDRVIDMSGVVAEAVAVGPMQMLENRLCCGNFPFCIGTAVAIVVVAVYIFGVFGGGDAVEYAAATALAIELAVFLYYTKSMASFSAEVDRLGGEVDRLEGENTRLSSAITQLETTKDELAGQVTNLTETARLIAQERDAYRENNNQFATRIQQMEQATIAQQLEWKRQNGALQDKIDQLTTQVAKYTELLGNLNQTAASLSETEDELDETAGQLDESADKIEGLIGKLNTKFETMSSQKEQLKRQLEGLQIAQEKLGELVLLQAQLQQKDEVIAKQSREMLEQRVSLQSDLRNTVRKLERLEKTMTSAVRDATEQREEVARLQRIADLVKEANSELFDEIERRVEGERAEKQIQRQRVIAESKGAPVESKSKIKEVGARIRARRVVQVLQM
ncbi:MAG: hypothetical protein S4CHLAM102_00360 [Chlamydiia bacterium]|nr:hypothetical protein [Chlamydiia bacterium]